MGDVEDNIKRLVDKGMWWIGAVDDAEPFAYTVGLHRLFQHPEVLLTGLRAQTAMGVLNALGNKIRDGARYETGERIAGVLTGGMSVALRPIKSKQTYRDYLGYALWFYGGDWFPVVQLVWPDKKNVLPTESGFDPALAAKQPLPE